MPQKDLHDAFFILLLLKLDNFEYVLVTKTKTQKQNKLRTVTKKCYGM